LKSLQGLTWRRCLNDVIARPYLCALIPQPPPTIATGPNATRPGSVCAADWHRQGPPVCSGSPGCPPPPGQTCAALHPTRFAPPAASDTTTPDCSALP